MVRNIWLTLFSAMFMIMAERAISAQSQIYVCSGYSCKYKTRLVITGTLRQRLHAIMQSGRRSAGAERAAISKAIQLFEQHSTRAIGVADMPKGAVAGGGVYGQMDCIDESTNTRAFLTFMDELDLLRHHEVEANASRGFFLDRRYPHATAVIEENGGLRWAVDSWYEPAGGPPDIMPLNEWRKRGILGER